MGLAQSSLKAVEEWFFPLTVKGKKKKKKTAGTVAQKEWNNQRKKSAFHHCIVSWSSKCEGRHRKTTSFLYHPGVICPIYLGSHDIWLLCKTTYTPTFLFSKRRQLPSPEAQWKNTHTWGLSKAAIQCLDSIWIHAVGLARWRLKAGSKGQLPLVLCPKAWDSLILS